MAPGEATVTATTGEYGSAQSIVSTTASLNIIESSVQFAESFDGEDIRIQFESGGSAAAAPSGGIDVTLTSSDGECVSVPSSVTIPGGQVDTTARVTYAVTASAPGFTDASVTVNLVQPGVMLVGVDGTQTTLDPNDGFTVRVGVPSGSGVSAQRVRTGAAALTATVTNSDGAVGQLVTSAETGQSVSVQIPAGQYQDSDVAFDPLAAGTSDVSVSIPGFLATDAASQTITVQ